MMKDTRSETATQAADPTHNGRPPSEATIERWKREDEIENRWRKKRRRNKASSGYRLLSEFDPRDVEWLWRYWIPLGMVSILEGDSGVGKSTVLADLTARATTGREMPDGSPGVDGGVVLLGAEDAIEETVRPKLLAMGADADRIALLELERDEDGNLLPLSIPEDLRRIEEAARGVRAKLVIIDPITGFLSERIDSHRDASTRRALMPLTETAHKVGAAVVMVRHLTKDTSADALRRGMGSVAFTGVARSEMVCGRHPDNPETFALARVVSNLAPPVQSRLYELREHAELAVAVVEWGDPDNIDADTLVRGPDGRKRSPQRDEVKDALREILADGPVPVEEIKVIANKSGIASWETWRKHAKRELSIVTKPVRKDGRIDHWTWELPAYMDADGGFHISLGGDSND